MTRLVADLALLAREIRLSYVPIKPVLVFPSAWMLSPALRAEVMALAPTHRIHLSESLTSPLITLAAWIAANP